MHTYIYTYKCIYVCTHIYISLHHRSRAHQVMNMCNTTDACVCKEFA